MELPTENNPVVIIHGDCREVIPQIPPGIVKAVLTDPPYGIFAHGGTWGKKADLQWDRERPDVLPLLDLSPHVIIWGGNYFHLPPSRGWIVWHKRDSSPCAADVELAWTSMDQNARLIDQTIRGMNPERVGHPTQKPLSVMRFSARQLPKSCDIILDPYAGVGTTGVAAYLEGRKAILIERELKYVDIARKRLAEAMSRPAVLSDGRVVGRNLFEAA